MTFGSGLRVTAEENVDVALVDRSASPEELAAARERLRQARMAEMQGGRIT